MRRSVALVVVGLAALSGCSSGSSRTASSQPPTTRAGSVGATTTTTKPAPATPDTQVWLCKPGLADNPCLTNEASTTVAADGTETVVRKVASSASDPKIDCFYVYPTVSSQDTINANLKIDPAEIGVAVAQASRYSSVCRVFAPMYRQVTITGLFNRQRNANTGKIAFDGVLSAWKDYLARYNDGRGIVLIGHSQGTFVLRPLISKYIDSDPVVRTRIVSAILLGGNVTVPAGKDIGGDFKHFGACRRASQTGCVIAFSSFNETPPPGSLFGRTTKAGQQVLCTNPAALAGGSGALDPYIPARLGRPGGPFDLVKLPKAETPWVRWPDLFTAKCENADGASWLQITDARKPGDDRPKLTNSLGPTWGLHLYDGNIALGNLVDIVKSQAAAYDSSRS